MYNSDGSNAATKQNYNYVTGNTPDSIFHRSNIKGFSLSRCYLMVQELFKVFN